MTPKKQPSIQDVIRQRQHEVFIGREDLIDFFREQLSMNSDDRRRRFVLSIFGQGGVGKTELLKEFHRIANEVGASAAKTNEDEKDVPAAISRLVEQFEGHGVSFHEFNDRFRTYRQKRDQLESNPDAPQGLAGFLAQTATKIGTKILRNTVPGSDLILDIVENPLADQLSQWAEFVRKSLGNKDEVELVLEPEKSLTPLFIKGLESLLDNHKAIIMFDTFERTCSFLDCWLHDLLEGKYGELPVDLIFVVAGREELDRNTWSDIDSIIAHLSIEPFTDEEARKYLARKTITNDKVIEIIISLSGRLPLLLATLAKESPNDLSKVGDATGTAVERFLKWVDDPVRRELALNAALPRRLNRDIVQLIGGGSSDFEWLCDNPFVERRAANIGWAYHEVVRTQMLRYKRDVSPKGWIDLHETLADQYRLSRDRLELSWKDGAKNSRWRDMSLEYLYHRLCADPEKHMKAALNNFVTALDTRRTFAIEWAATIENAGKDSDHHPLITWGNRLSEGLQAYENDDYEAAADLFNRLISWKMLEPENRPIIYAWRGQIYRLMDRQEEAIGDFDHAIRLNPYYAWAIAHRGATYFEMNLNDEALHDFNRAIELDSEYLWALSFRGDIYTYFNRYDEAMADYNRIIALHPEDDHALVGRGRVFLLSNRYGNALTDFSQVIELNPNNSYALYCRSITYNILNQPNEALADLNQVIELTPKIAEAHIESFKSLMMSPLMIQPIDSLDDLLVVSKEINETYSGLIDLFTQVETEDLLKRMEKFAKMVGFNSLDLNTLLEVMSKGTEQISNYIEWTNIITSAAIQLRKGHFDKALEYSTLAIDYRFDLSAPFIIRGETYLQMGQYEDALEDFNRVLELDPNKLGVRFSRWLTFASAGEEIAAQHELLQAAELGETLLSNDPDNFDYLFNLALIRVAQKNEGEAEKLYRYGLEKNPSIFILELVLEAQDKFLRRFQSDGLMLKMRKLVDDAIIKIDQTQGIRLIQHSLQ